MKLQPPSPGSRLTKAPSSTSGRRAAPDSDFEPAPSSAAVLPLREKPPSRFALREPLPQPPGSARCRLELGPRTDAELITFGRAHADAMRGNPYFAEPLPSTSVFDQWLTNFEGLVAQLENLRLELQSLTAKKNRLRAGFIAIFTQRSRYVEVASNGNSELIASAGLSVRRARTRRGDLPWPGNLRILLTKANGEFEVRWTPQRAARAFFLQIAEVIEGQPRVWEQAYTGSKANALLKNLTSGTIYEVRAATVGGPSGQSPWSPPVQRMAP